MLLPWIRLSSLIARAAGYAHDLGKATKFFQYKLISNECDKKKDPIRHECLSVFILDTILNGNDEESVIKKWKELSNIERAKRCEPEWFHAPVSNWRMAVEYIIMTHHKIHDSGGGSNKLSWTGFINEPGSNTLITTEDDFIPHISISPFITVKKFLESISRLEREVDRMSMNGGLNETELIWFWRGIVIVTRVAMILADHLVSARGEPPLQKTHEIEKAIAAFNRKCKTKNRTRMLPGRIMLANRRQPLDWHMIEIGNLAGRHIYDLFNTSLPGLSPETCEGIMEPATDSRYQWQDQAAAELARFQPSQPMLVLNMAGTGSGKTLGNVKILCALALSRQLRGQVRNESVRFSTALGLRSLTLQTGDAYRDRARLGKDEMVCIIGDNITRKLHEAWIEAEQEKDFNRKYSISEDDGDLVIHGMGDYPDLPGPLGEIAKNYRNGTRLLAPPVLVSTIDTLIRAGEHYTQGHHAMALLRLWHSDLILDEIDGYDPESLPAVMRLVTMAALAGRNVIASSATLTSPLASALAQSYGTGYRMRSAMNSISERQGNTFSIGYVNDRVDVLTTDHDAAEISMADTARKHIGHGFSRFMATIKAEKAAMTKRPMLQSMPEDSCRSTGNQFENGVSSAIMALHESQSWRYDKTGQRISFGLVRVARIRTAISLARWLSNHQTRIQYRIATYHANDIMIQRSYKEHVLDRLLNRHDGNRTIEDDPMIESILRHGSHADDVAFIVIATPVEEIGRDHDFDWAVIEPSSMHSIGQASGRVNRHRLLPVEKPNVAILQFNSETITRGPSHAAFRHPGFERPGMDYGDHDMAKLLDWNDMEFIDGSLCHNIERHAMARLDQESLDHLLFNKHGQNQAFLAKPLGWMDIQVYRDSRLRNNKAKQETFIVNDEKGNLLWLSNQHKKAVEPPFPVQYVERSSHDWLVLEPNELYHLASTFNIPDHAAMAITVSIYSNVDINIMYDRSYGMITVAQNRETN